jgi:hypothetical protein
MLMGGDRRSIGLANEVADLVRRQPKQVSRLIECLWDTEALLRMRAANAAEKLSRDKAVLLQPYKELLPGLMAEATQQEVRWHLALIIPRLQLSRSECQRAAEISRTGTPAMRARGRILLRRLEPGVSR